MLRTNHFGIRKFPEHIHQHAIQFEALQADLPDIGTSSFKRTKIQSSFLSIFLWLVLKLLSDNQKSLVAVLCPNLILPSVLFLQQHQAWIPWRLAAFVGIPRRALRRRGSWFSGSFHELWRVCFQTYLSFTSTTVLFCRDPKTCSSKHTSCFEDFVS